MRKILFLMLPVNFSGSIYSKAATAICFPIIAACFAASIWSNMKGVEVLFVSAPVPAIDAAKTAVCFIDPLAWMAFVLAIVSAIAFRKLETSESSFQGLDVKSYKRRSLLAATIFAAICVSLTFASYRLSDAGGQAGAGAYIDEKHKPEALAGIVDKRLRALNDEKRALAGAYADVLAELKSARAAAEKTEAATAGWARNGEKNWADYAKNQAAAKAKSEATAKIEAVRAAIAAKESIAERAHNDALEAEKRAHGQQSAKHEQLSESARAAMEIAVSCWTFVGLAAQAIACALTFGQYESVAYSLLVYEMKERAGNAKEIDKQLLALSAGAQAGTQAGARAIENRRTIYLRRGNGEPPARLDAAKETVAVQESEPPARPQQEPQAPVAIQQAPAPVPVIVEQAPASEEEEALRVLGLNGQGIRLEWIRMWRVALADPGLLAKSRDNPDGMSKKEIALKYGCGETHIDNLRRCRKIITDYAGSEAAFLDAIQKI
jgi:hypothetical protein